MFIETKMFKILSSHQINYYGKAIHWSGVRDKEWNI